MVASPARIVSLIPSATEILCALGSRERLVGVSHECDYPPDVRGLPVLSRPKVDPGRPSAELDRGVRTLVEQGLSVYRVLVEELAALRPDLIVTQHQCEVCAVSLSDVERACADVVGPGTVLCSLGAEDLAGIAEDFRRVAGVVGSPERGDRLVRDLDAALAEVAASVSGAPRPVSPPIGRRPQTRPTIGLIEWLDPPMIAGGWMVELAHIAGTDPVIVTDPRRFETTDWEAISRADPDVVLITPCGFSVERTLAELTAPSIGGAIRRLRATREGRTYVADGNAYFNRPGPRIAESARIIAAVCHPDRLDMPPGVVRWP